ncbi:cyclic AMP-dependent transcription factor ATF-6 alpha-like [Uloborus diversus]|uniref:cyclic AMP-dependent transcription factor ATF-6 alpha-like n=1 Tax=Uloborus diversus TaxID=327109 RepID=UPI00240A85AE|nr:cyclic AMP-dependent transcription factor ATF-6 alpha-like [Uloborus diversus]
MYFMSDFLKIELGEQITFYKLTCDLCHFVGQKTVLNSEQIVKLTSGTLPTPLNVAIPVPSQLQGSKTAVLSGSNRTAQNKKEADGLTQFCAAALKRQERIIKNRQSAHQSRMRRKEYVENLEAELKQMTAENCSLREENCQLKLKISVLENEVLKLKSTFSPKKIKTTFCFMFVICILTLNFSNYSSVFDAKKMKPLKQDIEGHRFGRILLWENENGTKLTNSSKTDFRSKYVKREVASYIEEWDQSYNSSSCHHHINKTESLRLENDLLGWVERVEKKQKLNHSKLKKNKINLKSPVLPLPKLQSGLRQRMVQRDVWGEDRNWNEILIYETPRKIYEQFFGELHRREDTFYFVSFSGDHLLLPAIAHNQTHRPRMSFVMPAMTFNDSIKDSKDHVSMMQIDCEVMDTKLIYIKHSNIPEHLRQDPNNRTDTNSKHGSSSTRQNRQRLHGSSSESSHRTEGKG